jgi:hypothetical protein
MSRHVEIAHRNHSGTLDSTAETAPAPLPAGEVPEADGRSGKEAMARDILCLDFFGSSQLATPDLNEAKVNSIENFDFFQIFLWLVGINVKRQIWIYWNI